MILVVILSEAFVERAFNVNKHLLQTNLEFHKFIQLVIDHLVGNHVNPELILISKEQGDSMKKLAASKGLIMKTEKKKKCLMRKTEKLMC